MGESTISVRPYDGTLASLNLGGLINQNVLNDLDPAVTGTITGDDGTLDASDTGSSRFTLAGSSDPQTLTYIGGGTISTLGFGGITLLSNPIAIFEAGGQLYFYLPKGLPPLSAITFRIDISANTGIGLPDFVPCFASGTRIMTSKGNIAIENIRVGDYVIGTDGCHHQVLWRGEKRINLAELGSDAYARLVPVRIQGSTSTGLAPREDLVVSQQHRILLRHPAAEYLFGLDGGFAAAKCLVGTLAHYAYEMESVTYHHILCGEHVTLLANGVEAESLFLGDLTLRSIRPEIRKEIELLFPELCDPDNQRRMMIAHPELKSYETQVLAHTIVDVPQTARRSHARTAH